MTDDQSPDPLDREPPPDAPEAATQRPPHAVDPHGAPLAEGSADVDPTLEGGPLEVSIDVVTSPVATLRAVTAAAPVGWATIVLVVTGLLGSFGQSPGMTGRFGQMEVGRGPGTTIGFALASAILSPVFVAIGAAIVVASSRLLSGRASWRSLYSGFGFANVPSAFGVVGALFLLIGGGGPAVAGLLGFALGVWVLVLGVIAVREANGFTTGRAVAAVAIPFAVVVVAMILVMIFLAVTFGALVAR